VALELEPDIFYQKNLKVVKASQVIVSHVQLITSLGIRVLLFIKNHEYKLVTAPKPIKLEIERCFMP
jgi:hypothetical protein